MITKRTFEKVIVHCSATPDDSSVEFDVNDIRRWHKRRGWSDCGYHWVITRGGLLQRGRDEILVGAHCRGENYRSVGVCLVGSETYEKTQMDRLIELFYSIKNDYKIGVENWYCHNEFTTSKTCPGFSGSFLRNFILESVKNFPE